jgi:hypothetical protein
MNHWSDICIHHILEKNDRFWEGLRLDEEKGIL